MVLRFDRYNSYLNAALVRFTIQTIKRFVLRSLHDSAGCVRSLIKCHFGA